MQYFGIMEKADMPEAGKINAFKDIDANNTRLQAERKKRFAINLVSGQSHADAARNAGVPAGSAYARGYDMSRDPEVQAALDELQRYSDIEVSEQLVTNMLMKEATTAGSSRDRREAAHLLGKTKAMFKDSVETTNKQSVTDLIAELAKVMGPDVAQRMAEELGLDLDLDDMADISPDEDSEDETDTDTD